MTDQTPPTVEIGDVITLFSKQGICNRYTTHGWKVSMTEPIMRLIDSHKPRSRKRRQREAVRMHKRIMRAIASGDIKITRRET